MARQGRRREVQPRLPALPPESRTIGQVVAETIRFYGRHFWRSLALGIGPAAVTVAGYYTGFHPWLAAVVAGWILLASASYVGACVLVAGTRPPREVVVRAYAAA